VGLDELVFLPIRDANTNLHLYRAGVAHSMHPYQVPVGFISAFKSKPDFHSAPAYRSTWYELELTRPPLDRLAVRCALSVATDRKAIAAFTGHRAGAATGVVPPMPGYPARDSLVVSVDGRAVDVLSFDPRTARALIAKEGVGALSMELTFPIRNGSRELATIVQAQWREHLGIAVHLRGQEETAWEQSVIHAEYRDGIEDSWTAFCDDPYDFLVEFGPAHYVATPWKDAAFDAALESANRLAGPAERMRALFACEESLLRAMAVVHISFETWAYFEAPFVRGMRPNPFGAPRFKYASIDQDWRPS
jgi:ABC-type transport system substrate-binding protein